MMKGAGSRRVWMRDITSSKPMTPMKQSADRQSTARIKGDVYGSNALDRSLVNVGHGDVDAISLNRRSSAQQ
jgi:hypothetical protein